MTTSPTESYRAARDLLQAHRSDHATAIAEFRWPDVGDHFNWVHDWFLPMARDNAARALVIVDEDGTRTERSIADLADRTDRLGAWLLRLGVRRGDTVMLMLDNQVQLWESMLALIGIGAVVAPTTTAVGGHDLADRIERARVRFVIADGAEAAKFAYAPGDYVGIRVGDGPASWHDFADGLAEPAPALSHPGNASDDTQLLYFTSGTTSTPKLVAHTHTSYPVGHLSTMYWLGLRPGDVHLAISSPGWAKHAWSNFFAPWIAGACVFVSNYSRFDPAALLATIRAEGVTTFCAPPTVWRMLIQLDLSDGPGTLRETVSAGEPLNPEVIEHVRRVWGRTIRDGYGQTEMTAIVANTPGADLVDGSMGRPLPGAPVVLVDPLTGALADEGEICLDLSAPVPFLMAGYVAAPERNAEATRGGFYHTGDVASRDSDGHITYIGRTDDVFKASDYKISPFELESVLVEHPAVVEAAVVPAPDPVRLAVPKAYVQLAAGYAPDSETARSILAHARRRLAPFQRLRRIEFAELPKTISGKIRRVELREREEAVARGEITPTQWLDTEFPELRAITQE